MLIVERAQPGQCLGFEGWHANLSMLLDPAHYGLDKGVELVSPGPSAHIDDFLGKITRGDDPSTDRVLKIMRAIGDSVSPADDVTLDRERRRP